jgi:hypothetical protein
VTDRRRRPREGLPGLKSASRVIGVRLRRGLKMTAGGVTKGQVLWRGIAALMGLLAGLCTIFAFVVTAVQAWQERAQSQWPEVTARVDKCGLDQTSSGRREKYYIHCRLSYAVGAEQNATNIYSTNVPSSEIWQYPPNQIGPLKHWVNEHPQGTPIVVHYDPANHGEAVLVRTDMPRGGPRTPNNLKVLGVFAAACVLLLTIARITRLRSDAAAVVTNG